MRCDADDARRGSKYDFKSKKRKGRDGDPSSSSDHDQDIEESVRTIAALLHQPGAAPADARDLANGTTLETRVASISARIASALAQADVRRLEDGDAEGDGEGDGDAEGEGEEAVDELEGDEDAEPQPRRAAGRPAAARRRRPNASVSASGSASPTREPAAVAPGSSNGASAARRAGPAEGLDGLDDEDAALLAMLPLRARKTTGRAGSG
jgi:hypothetical protein